MNLTTAPAGQVLDPPPERGGGSPADLRGVVVVGVDGDVDNATSPELLQVLEALLSPPTAGSRGERVLAVVVDLTEVEFVDSAAVGVLVRGHHLAHRSGRGYALVATHPMIHALFEVTGLGRVLPLHPDAAAAAASVTPRD